MFKDMRLKHDRALNSFFQRAALIAASG